MKEQAGQGCQGRNQTRGDSTKIPQSCNQCEIHTSNDEFSSDSKGFRVGGKEKKYMRKSSLTGYQREKKQ